MKRSILLLLTGVIGAVGPLPAFAFSDYVSQIPNGSVNSCTTCHEPNFDLNAFGQAFANNDHTWDATLAGSNSDDDGFSNGQELGDPTGIWTDGAGPIPGAQVTLPGDSSSVPSLIPPVVSITAPTDGMNFPDPFAGPVEAAADNPPAITMVEFFDGGSSLGTVNAPPFSLAVSLGAGAHVLTAEATDYLGATGASAAVTISVEAAAEGPTITQQPQSQTVSAGDDVSFTVVAAGTAPLSYQWRKDGNDLTGETGETLNLTAVGAADEGEYSVVVSNTVGPVTSAPATLTVETGPVDPAEFIGFVLLPNGNPELTLSGTPGGTYTLQRTGALEGPATAWSDVEMITMDESGTAVFEDAEPGKAMPLFYRAVAY